MNLKKFTVFCTGLILGGVIFAQTKDIKSLVNPEYYEKLIKNGNVSESRDDGSSRLVLMPESVYGDKIKDNLIAKTAGNYPFTYETLYLLNKKDVLKNSNSKATDVGIDDISEICRSISKMQGMKYYSSTRKKEVVLYENAYMIENPDSKKPISDVNTGNANGQKSYCLLDDNSFGVCRYELNYYQSGNEILGVFSNLDILGFGPFKAVYPEKLTIKILVEDCGDDVLLYICCDLDSVKYPGIKAQISDSMISRVEALYKWVLNQF